MSSQRSKLHENAMEKFVRKVFNSPVSVWLRIVLIAAGIANLVKLDLLSNYPKVRLALLIAAAVGAGAFLIQGLALLIRTFSSQIVLRILSRKYGFTYELLDVEGHLDPNDGSMDIKRHIRLRAHSPLSQVDHYLRSIATTSHQPVYQRVEKISPTWARIDVKPSELEPSADQDRLLVVVTFDPPLHRGACAEYVIHERFPAATFCINVAQLRDANMEEEYLVWAITRPTRHFHLRVSLPNILGLDPEQFQHDVWFGGHSPLKHEEELKRLDRSFSTGGVPGEATSFLDLDSQYPVLGLRYAVKWRYK